MTLTYDYEKQEWTDDDDVHRRRLLRDLELLRSDRGASFAAFINVNRQESIDRITALLEK